MAGEKGMTFAKASQLEKKKNAARRICGGRHSFIAYPSGRKVWYNNYRQNLTAILKSCADFMGYENQWKPKGEASC